MDPFESAWESWIRPVLVIAVALLLGVSWWAGWLPDAALGWPLLAAALLVPAGVALHHSWSGPGRARATAVALALSAVLVAAWAPVQVLGPDGEVAVADVSAPTERVTLPARAEPDATWVVHLHGQPADEKAKVTVSLELPQMKTPLSHSFDLVERLVGGRGGARTERHTEVVWPVRADLSRGAAVAISPERPGTLRWPVHVEVRRAPSPAKVFLWPAAALALVAAFFEARRRAKGTALTWLVASAGIFSAAFAGWFAPGTLVKTVFGSVVAALVFGFVVSWPLVGTLRRLVARPRPAVSG